MNSVVKKQVLLGALVLLTASLSADIVLGVSSEARDAIASLAGAGEAVVFVQPLNAEYEVTVSRNVQAEEIVFTVRRNNALVLDLLADRTGKGRMCNSKRNVGFSSVLADGVRMVGMNFNPDIYACSLIVPTENEPERVQLVFNHWDWFTFLYGIDQAEGAPVRSVEDVAQGLEIVVQAQTPKSEPVKKSEQSVVNESNTTSTEKVKAPLPEAKAKGGFLRTMRDALWSIFSR